MTGSAAALSLVVSLLQPPAGGVVVDPAQAVGDTGGPRSGSAQVVVHIMLKKPDPERGVLKLAKYRSSTATPVANGVIITTLFDELCSEPCGVPVDVSERPLLFLVRDGRPVSYGFRLNQFTGEVTLQARPSRQGLFVGGIILTGFFVLPAGIPMLIAGLPKVWAAQGRPGAGLEFKKLKKAKM